jgi:hypothetical protein
MRPHRARPPDPRPIHDPALLDALAGFIDHATAAHDGASLWGIATTPREEIELALLPLEGHPFDELIGFEAPAHWMAMGVRATGRGRSLAEPHPAARAVAATMVLGRDGTTRSRLRWLDRGPGVCELGPAESEPGPVEGLVADACRRSLGLPTAPPSTSATVVWTLLWLDNLVERAGDTAHRPRTWADAVALHPAAQAADPDGSWVLDHPDGLVAAARAHAATWRWERLRREPCALGPVGASLPAGALAWMDEGLFSRWLLTELPDDAELLGSVVDVLPAQVAAKVIGSARTLLDSP